MKNDTLYLQGLIVEALAKVLRRDVANGAYSLDDMLRAIAIVESEQVGAKGEPIAPRPMSRATGFVYEGPAIQFEPGELAFRADLPVPEIVDATKEGE